MDTSGVYITAALIQSLTDEERAFVFGLLSEKREPVPSSGAPASHARSAPADSSADGEGYDEHFAELSPGQAREFYAGCSAKTRAAITAIASSATRQFQLADVARAVGVDAPALRNVWSGLTMRTRTVTGDGEAYLIDWVGTAIYDDNDRYVDQTGQVTDLTHNSFRKILNL